MSDVKNELEQLSEEMTKLLTEGEALVSLSKPKGSLDMEITVKSTPFISAFMGSAIGHTNRKLAVAMLIGLLCAIFRENEDKTEEMNDIITALSSVLSMEEIKIMEESAIAAYVMRKNVEAGKIERNDINENTNTNSIANVFGNINTNTVQ